LSAVGISLAGWEAQPASKTAVMIQVFFMLSRPKAGDSRVCRRFRQRNSRCLPDV
jgi:hypothetical protein